MEERTVVVQVFHHSVQIDLKYRFVHFLHQQFGKIVETEASRALDKYHLIVQIVESRAADERRTVREKVFLGHLYHVSLRRNLRTYANNLLHPTLARHSRHVGIEFVQRSAALIDVAQNECPPAPLMVGPSVHKVKSDVERVDVRVVRVVYQCASPLSFLYLQTHRHRLESPHAPVKNLRRKSQMQCHDRTRYGVSHRSLVYERQRVDTFLTFIYIMYCRGGILLFHRFYEERRVRVLFRPCQTLTIVVRSIHSVVHNCLVRAVDRCAGVVKKRHLLTAFCLLRLEVFLMGGTQIGNDAYGGLYYVAQREHLSRLAYTSLKQSHLRLLGHQPDRQRHAYL